MITEVKKSKARDNVEYIEPIILNEKKTVISRAHLTRIETGKESKNISLKIGRYNKAKVDNGVVTFESLESENPKSELTLDNEELQALVKYLNDNYYPLKSDATSYISLSKSDLLQLVDNKKEIVKEIVEIAISKRIDTNDIKSLIEIKDRKIALERFKKMLKENAVESEWQKWFEQNNWVLGVDFIGISPDRRINESNIADFIAKSIDGYVDVIEIKRPGETKDFFENKKDHDNLVPSSSLTKAITQLVNYLSELEKESNNIDTSKRIGSILKPKGFLIYGSSRQWKKEEFEAYRLLNDSLTNITILTYDMVFQRAVKMNEFLSNR